MEQLKRWEDALPERQKVPKGQRDGQHEPSSSRGGKTHFLRGRKCQRDGQHEPSSSRGGKTHAERQKVAKGRSA
jgi:hypothetical protein